MALCGVRSYSQLLVLPEPLESSPGEVAGPGRLVLSTLAMIMYGIGKTPITPTIEMKVTRPQGDWKRTTDGSCLRSSSLQLVGQQALRVNKGSTESEAANTHTNVSE